MGRDAQTEDAEYDDQHVDGEDVGDAEGETEYHREDAEPGTNGIVSYLLCIARVSCSKGRPAGVRLGHE